MSNFEEYKKLNEPDKKEKSEIWKTAIGLQEVDGLKPSKYLIETAKSNIEGNITFEEVKDLINNYYQEKPFELEEKRTEEADKVSANIAEILSKKTFVFSPAEYIATHGRLFAGIYDYAGNIREFNISKKEWVLDGESVIYACALNIKQTLEYDFKQEKEFKYKGLSRQEKVEHIAKFISSIWQIHDFAEGNTRTTAVFTIKYLRSLGFNVNNDMFSKHAWYFRNALVRANYSNYNKNIYSTYKYINMFFENLLLNKNHELKNRNLHISNDRDYKEYLKNNKDNKQHNKNKTSAKHRSIDKKLKDVLTLIEENNNITANRLAEKLSVSIATIKRRLKKLKEQELIKRIGSDKTGFWEVITINRIF